jgi:TRAP-type C4-dicarboxylate transport system permease small subunit
MVTRRHAAALAIVGWFLFLAAAMIISGASFRGLTIRDIEETVLTFWPRFLIYVGASITCSYLVTVLIRRPTKTYDSDLDGK